MYLSYIGKKLFLE